jgi:hypothetical protein
MNYHVTISTIIENFLFDAWGKHLSELAGITKQNDGLDLFAKRLG